MRFLAKKMHLICAGGEQMKPDRPLIASILSLAAGLWLTFFYCQGSAGLSAGFPISSSIIHFTATTSGPAALGGIVLTGIGVALLIWSALIAFVGQIMELAGSSNRGPERLFQ
jgi:hypothetical protein